MEGKQLAVEIGRTDSVRIHKDKLPDSRTGQGFDDKAAHTSQTEDDYPAVSQLSETIFPDQANLTLELTFHQLFSMLPKITDQTSISCSVMRRKSLMSMNAFFSSKVLSFFFFTST